MRYLDVSFDLDALLPAVVLGRRWNAFAVENKTFSDRKDNLFHFWQHQYGGYACAQAAFAGCVLSLKQQPWQLDLQPIVSGLEALAADSSEAAEIRAYPNLSAVHLTSGQPYSADELQRISQFLAPANLPNVEAGEEALLLFEPCDLVSAFRGWQIATGATAENSQPFERQTFQALADWLDEPRSAIRAFLIWNNSD